MRIGTWNLEGRWSDGHRDLIESLSCDVLLLTEVPLELDLPGYRLDRCAALMSAGKHWSAVASLGEVVQLSDPHPTSSSVELDGVVVCCSVLPWPLWRPPALGKPVWSGGQAERMSSTVEILVRALRDQSAVIWGGDWNTPLSGSLSGFSRASQRTVLAAVGELDLTVPTAELDSATPGCRSIDHVAVPRRTEVRSVEVVAVPRLLSDHWAYVVEAEVAVGSASGRTA